MKKKSNRQRRTDIYGQTDEQTDGQIDEKTD